MQGWLPSGTHSQANVAWFAPQSCPATQPPSQVGYALDAHGGRVVLEVVVVGGGAQPASQQLASAPTHALPPLGALQLAPPRLMRHRVTPVLLVRQQVTKPGFPQVERDAHFLTNRAQLLLIRTASACCSAQRT